MAAQIHTGTITTAGSDAALKIYNFISQYDNRFEYVSGSNKIIFDDKFMVHFDNSNNCVNVKDMSDNLLSTYSNSKYTISNVPVIFITDTNFVMFKVSTTYAWYWVIQGNEDFFSFMYYPWYGYNVDSTNAENKFTRIQTQSKNCGIPQNFPYTVISPKIMFANNNVMLDTSGNAFKIDSLKACSTVALDSNVAVNGKNYYALGTNTLIEVVDT